MQRRITSAYYNYYYKSKVKLLSRIVSGFKYNNPEELMAIAKIELLYAMIHLDYSKASLNTYIYQRIYGNVLRHMRDEKEWCKKVDIDLDLLGEESDSCSRDIFINEILSCLSNKEKNVIELYYLENNTLKEISEKLDISTNCVFNIKNKAIIKIKETFSCQ